MPKVWRILSIDGGGVRGIIPATVLAAIEERTQRPIAQLFDLIAGTSTGGILALGLTKPNQFGHPEFSAKRLCERYKQEIPGIFRNPQSCWGNLLSPKYNSSSFKKVIKESLGDCQLKTALTDILIPCYDIVNRLPHIFKSRWARMHNQHDFLMSDVAVAAASTPTLFHPARVPTSSAGEFLSLIDGGVFANNPAMYALAEAGSMFSAEGDDYLLVSLGTGESRRPLPTVHDNLWGYVHWSRPMLELVSESNSESVHTQMTYLLPPTDYQRYYRFQVNLPEHKDYALDNASKDNLQKLFRVADGLFDSNRSRQDLEKLCEILLRLSSAPKSTYRRAA